jgi:hypothetical protein
VNIDIEKIVQNAVLQALGVTGRAGTPETPEQIGELGRPVIVRSRDAGVVFGEYAGNNGDTVHIKNARQLWSWTAAKGGTLLDCATHGVSKGKFSSVSDAVTVFNACALIDCTDEAAKSIGGVDVSFQ